MVREIDLGPLIERSGAITMTEFSPDFVGFNKIHRLSRPCIVTEKIDGTNAQIYITDDGQIFAGSRTRWITPEKDNFGFATWVQEHRDELIQGLGPGRHFGEWWGRGIQRNYYLKERRFSLFNVVRWSENSFPTCCSVVPIIETLAEFNTEGVEDAMRLLGLRGSYAAPGFERPEGIVVYHIQGNVAFKKTFENDQEGKQNAV
jgi:hypothetical protein